MMLPVFTNKLPVGELARADQPGQFSFRYVIGTSADAAVSLTMPPTVEVYESPHAAKLHPVFDQSLPEGQLREAIVSMFSKTLPYFDDYNLLEIVGRSQIGRLRFATTTAELDQVPTQSLKDLLTYQGTEDIFVGLLRRYATYSGVAGVQPKVLIRADGTPALKSSNLSDVSIGAKVSSAGTTHLVKTFDPTKYPGLALNEHHALSVAADLGLPVAKTEVSNNGKFLVVDRFDLKPDGSYLGFEDCCALSGRLSRDKYTGSYEQLTKLLAEHIRSPRGTRAELADFYSSLCVSIAVRNGDAHRKNFGVLYDSAIGQVILSPVFDVITTTVYVPDDTLALTIDGTKRWPDAKRLKRFGVVSCQLTPKEAEQRLEAVRDAVDRGAARLNEDEFRHLGCGELYSSLKQIWSKSIESLTPSKSTIPAQSPKSDRAAKSAIDRKPGQKYP